MLSFMTTNKHDVRPHLLLLFHAQDVSALPAVLTYGHNYLIGWTNAASVTLPRHVIPCAALDAVNCLWRRRASANVNVRAKQLGIRSKTYRDIRGVAIRSYRRRLEEAEERFNSALG